MSLRGEAHKSKISAFAASSSADATLPPPSSLILSEQISHTNAMPKDLMTTSAYLSSIPVSRIPLSLAISPAAPLSEYKIIASEQTHDTVTANVLYPFSLTTITAHIHKNAIPHTERILICRTSCGSYRRDRTPLSSEIASQQQFPKW